MRRALTLAACALLACALLALPGVASSQTQVGLSSPPPAGPISVTSFSGRVTGEVSVSFHPAPGSCAALASCGYSGVIAWTPQGGAALSVTKYRQHRRSRYNAQLLIGGSGPGSLTASTVRRSSGTGPPAECADEQAAPAIIEATEHGAVQTFTLGGELALTRCAGPLPGDLAAAAPRVTVATRRLKAGRVELDFRAQRSFNAHGFAGTLTSTLVVALGRGRREATNPPIPKFPTQRIRVVTERLRVTGITGRLTTGVTATSNSDVCVLLDNCGLTGTLTLAPKPAAPDGLLFAIGPAKRPYRDFLAALGLPGGGRAAGIAVNGEVSWSDRGSVTASLRRPAACSDTAPLAMGAIALSAAGKSLQAAYQPVPQGFLFGGALRTRCPGPILSSDYELAAGTVSRSRLGQRSFAIPLHGSGSLEDEGYAIAPGGTITIHLRRGRIHQALQTVPSGLGVFVG